MGKGSSIVGRTTKEKDLGVIFSAHVNVSEQCESAASKGNQTLELIVRTIAYKEKQLIVPLCKAFVRPLGFLVHWPPGSSSCGWKSG